MTFRMRCRGRTMQPSASGFAVTPGLVALLLALPAFAGSGSEGRALAATPSPGASFRALGQVPGGIATYGLGVSGDGSVVVGEGWTGSNQKVAFRWTAGS